ncbi:hypothetical protein ACHAW5_009083 [Stephanodiscus triporus]|uniref:Uncharacterized protein n=1 Tax=Stephanodiscus triporus TaxID=2934178 RepID=A0ABD3QJG9_9STRA
MTDLAHGSETYFAHHRYPLILNRNLRDFSSWRIPPYAQILHVDGDGRRRRREEIWNGFNLPIHIKLAMVQCRGGSLGSSTAENFYNNDDFNEDLIGDAKIYNRSTVSFDACSRTKSTNVPCEIINASTMTNKREIDSAREIIDDRPNSPYHQVQHLLPRPRLAIEFDTHAVNGVDKGGSIRTKIRSRIGPDNEWKRVPNRGPALSISLDLSPPSLMATHNLDIHENSSPSQNEHECASSDDQNLLESLRIPVETSIILLYQTAALLPHLILSRRALNYTWIAIVDYFRGRTFRTTYTKLERAYLRYYEFPAVTRACARLVSQIGILLGLSWAVRLWMFWVFSSDVAPIVFGATGIDIALVGARAGRKIAIGPGWKVGLPCHRRGKGMAWLCGFFWIGTVVGIGHVVGVALSVWGGPLRLQATAQHPESPKLFLRRIIHHPIQWIREMEEWKHFSLNTFRQSNRNIRNRVAGERAFDPDPLLFPVTWLPLRWLQILALAKAFSTDPLQYRWCPPENDKVVIPQLMKQYLVQLALGDEWRRVCLGEMRVGLGIVVILSYVVALVWMVCTTFTLDGGAAAMLIPSVFAAIISGVMNFMIFWNRLGASEQKKALNAIGFA